MSTTSTHTGSPHSAGVSVGRELLCRGVQSARAGNRSEARFFLRQSATLDPGCEVTWVWLAELADTADERIDCLRRVVDLSPTSGQAREALAAELVETGVAVRDQGQPERARELFAEAVRVCPTSVPALLLVASTADDPAEAAVLYDRVLAIDPHNGPARQARSAVAPSPDPVCPVCEAVGERMDGRCPRCRAVVTVDDPQAFDDPSRCDEALIRANLPRLSKAAQTDPTARLPFALALYHLGQTREALAQFKAVWRETTDTTLRERLYRLVDRAVGTQSTVRMKRPDLPPTPVGPLVVVAHVSKTMRTTVTAALKACGYRTACVCDGTEIDAAIQLDGVPALVVMGADLPNMDGFAACKMLRKRADTRAVPVVLIDDDGGLLNRVRGQLAGASEHLCGPFRPAALTAAARRLAPPTPPTGR